MTDRGALDSVDADRRSMGLVLGGASILIFLVFSGWAFCSAERFLANQINAYALLAKAIVFGTVVGFCYGLLRLADRLATPLVTLARIEEAKAKRGCSEGSRDAASGVSVNITPADLRDLVKLGQES